MSFTIFYDNQPKNFLKKLEARTSQRIIDKIDQTLHENPVPADAKPIVGEHGIFRIRIGDYRVLYRMNYSEKRIIIVKIDKRERVY